MPVKGFKKKETVYWSLSPVMKYTVKRSSMDVTMAHRQDRPAFSRGDSADWANRAVTSMAAAPYPVPSDRCCKIRKT